MLCCSNYHQYGTTKVLDKMKLYLLHGFRTKERVMSLIREKEVYSEHLRVNG